MPTSLPSKAVEKLVAPARNALPSSGHQTPVLPVTEESWEASLEDAPILTKDESLFEDVTKLNAALLENNASIIARNSKKLAATLQEINFNIRFLEFMTPAIDGTIFELKTAIRDLVTLCLSANELNALGDSFETIIRLRSALHNPDTGTTPDPVKEVFGLPKKDLLDSRGVLSSSILLSYYYGHYDKLDTIVSKILSPVTKLQLGVVKGIDSVLGIVACDHPLIMLRTASGVREICLESLDCSRVDRVHALRENTRRVDRSSANHARIARAIQQLSTSESETERAETSVDLYRMIVEGQLRPTCWGLLGLRGRKGSRMPELASIRNQLIADGHPTLRDAAEVIIPTVRNSAAHEDFLWNDTTELVSLGGAEFSIDELIDFSTRAFETMAASEIGIRCAVSESEDFAKILHADDPSDGLRVVNERTAVALFGTNGLQVQSWRREKSIFILQLKNIPENRINPTFQALAWAAHTLPEVTEFKVHIEGTEEPVLLLGRKPLELVMVTWMPAKSWFTAMPPSTFLPANTSARMAIEDESTAAQSASWIAVNDALLALIDYLKLQNPRRKDDEHFRRRLQIAGAAASSTMTLFSREQAPLRDTIQQLHIAIKVMSLKKRDRPLAYLKVMEGNLWKLYERFPEPPILPTLSPRQSTHP